MEAAEDGETALGMLSCETSLVVLDLTMPGLSGRDTYLAIRKDYPKLPVILYSGYSIDLSSLQQHNEDDSVAFVGKPFAAQTLLDLAERMLRPVEDVG